MKPIRFIVSACLLGERVRYDNKSKPENYVCNQLAKAFELIPVCPEFESGLGVPGEAMKLCGNVEAPELRGVLSGNDRTAQMRDWLKSRMVELAELEPAGFVLKNNSPSCGLAPVKFADNVTEGAGIFAACVVQAFPELAIAGEKQLQERFGRQKFLDKVILMSRFRELVSTPDGVEMLPDFHLNIKLCAMSHAPGRMAVTVSPEGLVGGISTQAAVQLPTPATAQVPSPLLRNASPVLYVLFTVAVLSAGGTCSSFS
jgi:uncharacterized protein YbbK (DUF523 family)